MPATKEEKIAALKEKIKINYAQFEIWHAKKTAQENKKRNYHDKLQARLHKLEK